MTQGYQFVAMEHVMLVEGKTVEEFEDNVMAAIAAGYRLQGGCSVSTRQYFVGYSVLMYK